jgi:(p)ppGpp synthase/HD superfamily hydrolase
MATLERAIQLAAIYHAGQFDKMGKPYILHPLRVMSNLGLDVTEVDRIVAVLHDAVEDTEMTLEMLRDEGFTEEAITAIKLLTKVKGYNEDEYYRNILNNPIARRVKIKDLEDNMDIRRMKNKLDLTDKDLQRHANYVRRHHQLTGS